MLKHGVLFTTHIVACLHYRNATMIPYDTCRSVKFLSETMSGIEKLSMSERETVWGKVV